MTWLRLNFGAVLLAAVTAGSAAAQPTPSNASRADAMNEEGKAAMQAGNFELASDRFHQATVLSAEGRFYFNLCVSLYQQGKLSDSLAACKAVEPAGADDALRTKTAKMTAKVKEEIRKLGFDPDAPVVDPNQPDPNNPNPNPNPDPNNPNPDPNNPNPDPNNPNPDPNNPNPNTAKPGIPIVAPPPMSLIKGGEPDHHYTWTLGFEVIGGNAAFGRSDTYTAGVYGFRFLGDYLIAPSKQIGAQATVGVLHTDPNDNSGRAGIDVVDIGIAGYKHLCKGRACITPVLGVSLGLMQPDNITTSDALLSIGFRGEARIGYALGKRYEHLLSLSIGFQGYTRAFDSSNISAVDEGLDKGSAIGILALGYTYRFNTPFGSSPFVTLE